jgi:hypothetical protein
MHGIVLAHGKANAVTNLHRITWDRYFDSYEILSPVDDPAFITNVKTNTRGLSEHNGLHTLERQRYAFELASKYSVAAVIEYDVILLDRLPIPNDMELYASEQYDDGQFFITNWYAHCPWVVTKKTAKIIASYRDRYQNAVYSDRWLAGVCEDANITHHCIHRSYSPHGGSVNSEHEENLLKDAVHGSHRLTCIHGNKGMPISKEIITRLVL